MKKIVIPAIVFWLIVMIWYLCQVFVSRAMSADDIRSISAFVFLTSAVVGVIGLLAGVAVLAFRHLIWYTCVATSIFMVIYLFNLSPVWAESFREEIYFFFQIPFIVLVLSLFVTALSHLFDGKKWWQVPSIIIVVMLATAGVISLSHFLLP